MWRLIAQGLLKRPWQSLATVVGVALGVALLVAAFLFYVGLREGLEHGKRRLGADLLVVPSSASVSANEALFSGSPLNVYMDQKYAEAARQIPGVKHVEVQFFTQSLQLECCSTGEAIRLIGIEPDAVRRFSALSSVRSDSLGDKEVIIGSRTLGGTGKTGTLIELLGEVYRVSYRLESTGTGLDSSILMTIATARRISAKPGQSHAGAKPNRGAEQSVSALLVEVAHPEKLDEVVNALQELGLLKVIRAAETFQRMKRMIGAFIFVLVGAGMVTTAGGITYLVGHVASTTWDRKGEWALYRSLGATKLRLMQLVVGEALLLSLSGVLIGFLAGLEMYHFTLAQLAAQDAFPFVPPSISVVALIAVGALLIYLGGGFLAAIGPAFRVTQLEPASVMAQGDID